MTISQTPFVSYAQNREDVLLFRALGHIAKGVYVDIGAAHPTVDSVTKAFYERGWSGINVEPSTQYFPLLKEERERDENFDCAISNNEGEVTFWDIPETGNSTIMAELGERYTAEGDVIHKRKVVCRKLASIVESITEQEVHFLKIDAEGAERQVLESADFSQFRPWVILVEATLPNSREQNHQEWESLILSKGYQFAFFDGLNRYYVAEEHAELMDSFSSPACVFDNFITYPEHLFSEECNRLRQSLTRVEEQRARHAEIIKSISHSAPPDEEWLGKSEKDEPSAREDELRARCKEMKDIILSRDSEIVELAEMNLRILEQMPKQSRFRALLHRVSGSGKAESPVTREQLEERLSKLRLELKERFQRADQAWLKEV